MSLDVPIDRSKIDAAARLYARLGQWRTIDAALELLSVRCHGFSAEATLLKVVAINSAYATNVYAQTRMAQHVHETLQSCDLDAADPGLVEQLARMPGDSRRFISFASKFVHFFIDDARFPILDKYAVDMVRLHLGSECRDDRAHRYQAFVENVQRLRQLAGLTVSPREMDRYLWLAGVYRAWRKDNQATINREAAELFASDSAEVKKELSVLIGDLRV